MDDILRSAVLKLEKKIMPSNTPDSGEHTKSEAFEALYPMLEIWDEGRQDDDNKNKTNFIYDYLMEHGGTPKDSLISIFTRLGVTPANETKIDRIYKYCRLNAQGDKILKHYESVQGEINALKHTVV